MSSVLANAMRHGVSEERYRELLPAVSQCLAESGCTTVDRIAMWCSQVGHESAGLKYMEELASGSAYEGRTDLGNVYPGDGVKFKGRGPIQVTGRYNYTECSSWAFSVNLVPSSSWFVDNPQDMASDTMGFTGTTWYWTTQRDLNGAADRRDIVGATKMVNGGTNGLADRTERYEHCLRMGTELLALVGNTPDGYADIWQNIMNELLGV